jgi:hypothetical protein
MPELPSSSFLRDPITVPRKELIEHYRTQAARYSQLAERQRRSSIYDGLISLAPQCTAMADALTSPGADNSGKPKLSEPEILLLLNRVVADVTSASTALVQEHSLSVPAMIGSPELSLDDILQKVQRDIAEGRPPAG